MSDIEDLQEALAAAKVTPDELADAIRAAAGGDTPDPPRPLLYELRRHRTGRPFDKLPDEVDWEASAVGEPRTFLALAAPGWWMALQSVVVVATGPMDTPHWSIRRAGSTSLPMTHGPVGHPMAPGDMYERPAAPGQITMTGSGS